MNILFYRTKSYLVLENKKSKKKNNTCIFENYIEFSQITTN